MSFTVDANVLLYAADTGSQVHQQARQAVEEAIEPPQLFYLFWPTAIAFLRISTHPGIFADPLSPGQAVAAIDRLISRDGVISSGEGKRFWRTYRALGDGLIIRGNLVGDAHLVARATAASVPISVKVSVRLDPDPS